MLDFSMLLKIVGPLLTGSFLTVSCAEANPRPNLEAETMAGRFVTIDGMPNIGENLSRRRIEAGVVHTEVLIPRRLDLSSTPETAAAATGMEIEMQCSTRRYRFVRQRLYRVNGEILTETALSNEFVSDPRFLGLLDELCGAAPSTQLEFRNFDEFIAQAQVGSHTPLAPRPVVKPSDRH